MIYFYQGIVQVVRNINRLPKNSTCGCSLPFWSSVWKDSAIIAIGETNSTLKSISLQRIWTWDHILLTKITEKPFTIWLLYQTITELWEEDIVSLNIFNVFQCVIFKLLWNFTKFFFNCLQILLMAKIKTTEDGTILMIPA